MRVIYLTKTMLKRYENSVNLNKTNWIDADLSPLPSWERARACPVLDTGVRVKMYRNIKTMLLRY